MNPNNHVKMRKVLLCGLDYSGKTTLVKMFRNRDPNEASEFFTSTAFMNLEKVKLPGKAEPCLVYDMSGQGRHRASWAFFYPEVDAIFFVVDATDRSRIDIARECLSDIARHPAIQGKQIPIVILSNKTDADDCVDSNSMKSAL